MTDALRVDARQVGHDHNGLIDLTEFRAYFQAPASSRSWRTEPQPAMGSTRGRPMVRKNLHLPKTIREPTVYRFGSLPKELPSWFSELDTDKDAQVGLYEWKVSGRPIEEFTKMDRNGDGFLTVDEVLYAQRNDPKVDNGTSLASAVPSGNGTNNAPWQWVATAWVVSATAIAMPSEAEEALVRAGA